MSLLTRKARLVRTLAWCGYVLLVVLTAALRLAAPSASLRTQLSDGLLYLLPVTLTLVGALMLGARASRTERRLWRLIAAISLLILCAETYYTWYTSTVDVHGPSMPAYYQILQLAAVFLGAWVVASLTDFGPVPARSRLRFALDLLGGMTVVASLIYWFLLRSRFEAVSGETWQGAAVASVYPVVGLCIVTFMSVAAAGGRTYRWRSWERLIAASFLLYGAGLVVTPLAYLQMRSSTDSQGSFWASVLLGFGYYVLFLAIVYRATSLRGEAGVEPWFFPRLRPSWFPTVYPIMLAATLPFLGVGALWIGRDPAGAPIAAAAVCVAAILVARSWLRSSEAMLHRVSANTDSVTGTFNYRYLRRRLEGDLAYAKATGASLSVITCGVEGLKTISSVAGPAEHDRVLACVASAFKEAADADATLCRTGMDVFVLIARGSGAEQARTLATALLAAANRAIEPLGAHVAFSAGIAVFPDHGDELDQLLARSGAAQEVSSLAEEAWVVVYDPNLEVDAGPDSRLAAARTRSRRATARVLAAAVDARDPETRRHSENVADLASALALMLDLSAERGHVLDLAAQMHDVGKIGVPDAVLRATGDLTDEQRALVEQHAVLGERILAAARLDEILPAVRHHHERWDGAGYPDGLSGTDIPLEARILTVCDAYESMTKLRSYGENLSVDEAILEIGRCSGTQFDPAIAAPFCRMISRVHDASPRDRAGRSADEGGRSGSLAGI
jgi:diguanylate cyclase (GGDEF)-like protein